MIRQHRWSAVVGVLTLAVAAAAIVYFTRPGEAIDSVAVMPLVNVSGDPNTEYLSDGISESITNNLSPLLKVSSVASVWRYKGKLVDPRVVGHDLNVQALLIARLLQHGDDVSISAELVDARDNHRLWGQQYTSKRSDIVSLQEKISRDVSEKLRPKLSGAQQKQITRHSTESTEALEAYWRFPISESKNIEFRAEFFNLVNHVNFANPINNLNAVSSSGGSIDLNTGRIIDPGDFGRITSTSNNPRLIQFALKVNF